MADINSAQNNGPVLSYTVTNDRGWNDPPSFAFSPNPGNRKRIDPRKRAVHDISTNGYAAPVFPQNTQNQLVQQSYQNPMVNNVTQTFNELSLASPSQMHHASSNPNIYEPTITSQPAPSLYPLHHSASVPTQMNSITGQNRIPGHSLGTMTPPPISNNTPPPFVQPRSGSATPPTNNNKQQYHAYSSDRKMSVPSLPYSSSIFDQHSTPTMLQSSHLSNSSNNPTQENDMVNNATSCNGHMPSKPTMYQPAAQTTPVPNGQVLAPNMFTPVKTNEPLNQGIYSMPSTPALFGKKSPTNITSPATNMVPPTTNMAPPTIGYYVRRKSNNTSPSHSGHSSPIPNIDPSLLENDQHAMQVTLSKLNECREKCSCNLTPKINEDIGKKIKVLESAWSTGRLSASVKGKMVQLADALATNEDLVLADRLHRSLLTDNSNEVSSWLVAIKKLISSYQDLLRSQQK